MKSVIFAGLLATAFAAEAADPQSTVYSTEMITITSCAPTVTDCPARSTGVSSKVHTLTQETTSAETVTSVSPQAETVTSTGMSQVVESSSVLVSSTLSSAVTSAATSFATSAVTSAVTSASTATVVSPVGSSAVAVPPQNAASSSLSPVGSAPAGSAPAGYPSAATSVSPVFTSGIPGAGAGSGASCVPYSVKTISTTTVVPTVVYETVAVPCAATSASSPYASGYSSPAGNGTITGSSPSATSAIVTAGAGRTFGVSALLAGVAGLVAFLA